MNRLRTFLALLGGLSLLSGGAAVYAFNQQQEAKIQTAVAEQQALNANIQAESFRVENLLASGLSFKALLAALELGRQIKALDDRGGAWGRIQGLGE